MSRCLLGDPARYNGGHSHSRFLTDQLARHVESAPICPEIEIGLGAPRQTLRLLAGRHLVNANGSADHTEAMVALAERRLPDLAAVDGYVRKSRSPSCGPRGIPRYHGDQPADRKGVGAFAAHIADAFPFLPMEEDGRLNDAFLREPFVERIFAHARLRALFASDWRVSDLVDFHTRHKLQILAHDPVHHRELGQIVSKAGTEDRQLIERHYTRMFSEAFAVRTRRGRHLNALQHLFGPMSQSLDNARRRDIVEVIEAFGRGVLPLRVPIALLSHDARDTANGYLQAQTYLELFPADLALRNHT